MYNRLRALTRQLGAQVSPLGLALPIAVLLIAGGLTWRLLTEIQTSRILLRQSYSIIDTLQNIGLSLTTAETGQRGYMLTGSPEYLLSYQAATAHVAQLAAELRTLVKSDPQQLARSTALIAELKVKFAEMAKTWQLSHAVATTPAQLVAAIGAGRDDMVAITRDVARVALPEHLLLQERIGDTDRRLDQVRLLGAGGTILASLVLLWAARRLHHAARTDSLTGLLSRNRMWELLTIWRLHPDPAGAALIIVDIDRFRSVNQVFGAATGDALLITIGRRLSAIAKRYPVVRLGGDDFAIWCRGISEEQAVVLAAQAASVLSRPFTAQGHSLHLTASVGVAHSEAVGQLDLRQASDDASYAAKQLGGNRATIFLPSMHEDRRDAAELERELHLAMQEEGQLFLMFQPVVSLMDDQLVAIECLARWTHPRLGALPPCVFIALAEARGMMDQLGGKFIALALDQARHWHTAYPGRCPLIHINISPTQFAGGHLLADLCAMLRLHDLPPAAFCLEVTESAFTDADALEALVDARALGFQVAMDDFGVGYASLSQMPRLPIASIKLDHSFISNAVKAEGDAAVLAGIVKIAHALNLQVIAEGVETPDQLALVTQSGCDAVQGYIFSRPLLPEAIGPIIAGQTILGPRQPQSAVTAAQ
jgi:diguanylate cyclase (GGDEF)-like protein